MQQLASSSLSLVVVLSCSPSYPSAASISALMSSSALQHLELAWVQCGGQPDLESRWEQLITPGRQLLQLRSLILECPQFSTTRTTNADLELLVQCCPALQELDLRPCLQQHALPSALLQLSALTKLCLEIEHDDTAAIVAQLTELRNLRLAVDDDATAAGLQQLTALKQLTSLEIVLMGKVAPRITADMPGLPADTEGPSGHDGCASLSFVRKAST